MLKRIGQLSQLHFVERPLANDACARQFRQQAHGHQAAVIISMRVTVILLIFLPKGRKILTHLLSPHWLPGRYSRTIGGSMSARIMLWRTLLLSASSSLSNFLKKIYGAEIEETSQGFSWFLWELRTSDSIQIVSQNSLMTDDTVPKVANFW